MSDKIEYVDALERGTPRMECAMFEQGVVDKHYGVCHDKPYEDYVFRKPVGEESVDPIYFHMAALSLVLHFIVRDTDGRISINLLDYVFSSGRAGIFVPEFNADGLAEQAEGPYH